MITANDLDEALQKTIILFHQNRVPSSKAAYYVTTEYFRLLRARAEAEANNQTWLEILSQLKKRCPDYAVRDFSNLADNSCYQGEILLHPNTSFLDDDQALLLALGGTRVLLRLFVSVLGPFYHLYIEEMDQANQFKIIESATIEQQQIVEIVKQTVEGYGYHFVNKAKLLEVVPDMTTAFHNQNEVLVFHCIFSDFMGFYQ